MKQLTLGLLAAVLITVTSCATQNIESTAGASETIVVSPNDKREYASITLDNQLTVLMVSDPSVDKSAASLSVGVGLLNDPMSQQGMAHYLEHMLFLGTDRYPDTAGYSDFMSKNGGASNAYTWLEITNYMFEINNAAYDEALDRFSDFFKTPKLYPEYVEKEKNAVNAEWSMRREMDFFGQFKLNRSMMGEHPANRFLIGNLETLSDKPESKLHPQTVAFYEQYYSANIMKVALVSNRPIGEMKALASKYFASIKNKNVVKPKVKQKLDFEKLGKKRIHYVPNQDVKSLTLDFTIENNSSDYKLKPNYFVSYLLGSEMPGTPAFELKKAGLIASLHANASANMYGNYGTLSVALDLTDAGMKNRESIVKVVMNYIDLIKREGVDSRYFKEIKTQLNNEFRFLEKGNAFGYVSSLSDEMQSYPVQDVISAPYLYQSFDASAIRRVLKQLTPETLRIWYVSKQEPFDKEMHFYDGKYKIVEIADAEIQSWSEASQLKLSLPNVNKLLPEAFELKTEGLATQEKPEVVFDQSGIKAWQFPSQAFAEQPKGVFRAYFNSPEKQAGIKGQVLFSLWADLFALNQSALMAEATNAGMDLRLTDANGLELSVSGFTDKQPLLFERGLIAMKFNVAAKSFEQAVDRYVRGLNNLEKQFPIRQLFGYVGNIVNASGHSNADLIATAQVLTPKDLHVFMEKVLANNQIRMFAFGNYDTDDIGNFVAQTRKMLPKTRKTTTYTRNQIWAPQKNQTLVLQKDLEVADVAVLDLLVHPEPSLKQEARARVLAGHLRTATFDKLRTEEQLAYAVAALTTPFQDFTSIGFAIQTPVKSVADMQKRFDDFKGEYQDKLKQLTTEEFSQLKNSVLVALKEKPKNLREEQAPMLNDWYQEKWGFDTREKLIAEVEQVNLDDIKRFYNETLMSNDVARLSVQLRGSKFKDKPFAKLEDASLVKDLEQFHQTIKYQQN